MTFYLDLALELGIPAAVPLVSAVAAPVMICARGVRARRRDRTLPAVGVSLVGAHSMVDYHPDWPLTVRPVDSMRFNRIRVFRR